MGERERWVAAVQARLEHVTATQDLERVLGEVALTEAHELARTLSEDPGDLLVRFLLGWAALAALVPLSGPARGLRSAGPADSG